MIGLTDIFFFLLFLVFTVLALVIRQAFVFAIAGFFAMIAGIDLAILGGGDLTNSWAYGIFGFALIFFGFWLLVFAIQVSSNEGQKK